MPEQTRPCEKCQKLFAPDELVPHRVNLYTMQVCEACNTQMARDMAELNRMRATLEEDMRNGWGGVKR